jgi:hypothetical protein
MPPVHGQILSICHSKIGPALFHQSLIDGKYFIQFPAVHDQSFLSIFYHPILGDRVQRPLLANVADEFSTDHDINLELWES